MRVIVIGGSGFLSGAVARVALAAGHAVEVVTRGRRAVPAGVRSIVADRDDGDSFGRAIASVDGAWDVVIDCIGFTATHARQDLDAFVGRTPHVVSCRRTACSTRSIGRGGWTRRSVASTRVRRTRSANARPSAC